MTKTLFISGSGFDIFAQAGVMRYINTDFDIYAGTSAGSFLSCAMVFDWKLDDLYQWCIQNVSTFKKDLHESLWNLLTGGALISEKGKQAFITKMIQDSPLYKLHFNNIAPTSITFEQLAEVTNKRILCNAVQVNTDYSQVFSLWTTPQFSIHYSIMSSMSLAGLFRPTLMNGAYYMDGGFAEDYLPSLFDPNDSLYYKIRYPNVTIPIDLNNSWGILHWNKTMTQITGSWTVISLIKLIPNLFTYYISADLNREPIFALKERTWTVSYTDVYSFPSESEITKMYQSGYQQALQQGRKSLDDINVETLVEPNTVVIKNTHLDAKLEPGYDIQLDNIEFTNDDVPTIEVNQVKNVQESDMISFRDDESVDLKTLYNDEINRAQYYLSLKGYDDY
jgi:predicted acylesterase/phospholipase RssA